MIPIVVNSPESMLKLKILAVKDDREKALKSLQKVGVLHIEDTQELTPVDKDKGRKRKGSFSS